MNDDLRPDPALRASLVRGIRTYEERRCRRRLAAGGVVSSAVLVGALAVRDGDRPTDLAGEVTTVDQEPDLQPVDERIDLEAIDDQTPDGSDVGADVVLLATDGNGGNIAIADLTTNRRVRVAGTTDGAITAGLLTERHVWVGPPAIALDAPHTDPIGGLIDGALDRPHDMEDGWAVRRAVATDDGRRVWLDLGGDAGSTHLRLVDAELSTVVELTVPGGLLVDVSGDDAVLDLSLPEGDGGLLVVSPDGSTREVARPAGARLVTATPEHTVWVRMTTRRTNELVIVDERGQQTALPPPEGGNWAEVAQPTIPGESPDLKAVTEDGRLLLVGETAVASHLTDDAVTHLTTIDLETGAVHDRLDLRSHGGGLRAAFWTGDDSLIVAVVDSAEGLGLLWTEPGSGLVRGLGDVVPPGYFVIAAR